LELKEAGAKSAWRESARDTGVSKLKKQNHYGHGKNCAHELDGKRRSKQSRRKASFECREKGGARGQD